MGFVLVQHLDPAHDSALTALLGRATSLPVHEVTNNSRVESNHVYVIPPNTNLSIAAGVLKLSPRPKTRTPHRSIDFFFEAFATDQGDGAIGMILSGTATDGTVGLEAIKAEGVWPPAPWTSSCRLRTLRPSSHVSRSTRMHRRFV